MNPFIAALIQASGRSWWQCRYRDGKVLSEWDTLVSPKLLPVGRGQSSRWETVPKAHMVGLRLLCPNGMAAELEAPDGSRFLQLKVGAFNVGTGGSRIPRRTQAAHIIGVVLDADGNCLCRAWEYRDRRLVEFKDNIYRMKYENIGRLNLDAQGLKV